MASPACSVAILSAILDLLAAILCSLSISHSQGYNVVKKGRLWISEKYSSYLAEATGTSSSILGTTNLYTGRRLSKLTDFDQLLRSLPCPSKEPLTSERSKQASSFQSYSPDSTGSSHDKDAACI